MNPAASLIILAASILCLSAAPTPAETIIQSADVVAICGDSITQQCIYSVWIEDYLLMCQPIKIHRTVAFGWAGETSGGFLRRMESDIQPFTPSVVTLFYGRNDGNYRPVDPPTVDAFRKNITDIVRSLKSAGVRRIILGSPGVVDTAVFKRPTATADQYNETLATLGSAAKDVAASEGIVFADVCDAMTDAMQKSKSGYGQDYPFVGKDGVHPSGNGHLVIAYAFLKSLGFDGSIGTITLDLATNHAEGTPGHEIVTFRNGTAEINSTRYPFCFHGDPNKPDSMEASILKYSKFNEDLNRYILIVKNLKSPRAKVTWGNQTLEFSAEDLKKGINLAAEFITGNPFLPQWERVDKAVKAQQEMETPLVQQFLHNRKMLDSWSDAENVEKILAGGMSRDQANHDAAAALVIPVRHTIKIEY